jgi:1-acyl-sn-glycerol-3-phosphate acyltransferase
MKSIATNASVAAMSQLSRIEKLTLTLCRAINERPVPKELQRLFLKHLGSNWVTLFTRNLLDVSGLEHLRALDPKGGVLLCANHRSFFDLYVVAAIMWKADLAWNRKHIYPVRSTFFYESLTGLGVNLVMGGGCMYPPIFRDASKNDETQASVETIIEWLEQPGVVVGVHPEGTRGKGPDPYELLPAQPGIGQMALKSEALVVPVWISGLGNNLPAQILSNFQPENGEPISVRFGPPVDLSEFAQKKQRLAIYKRAADRIMDAIRELGEATRAEQSP